MKKQADYGRVVTAKEAGLLVDDMLPKEPPAQYDTDVTSVGNALWSYKFEGRINGIPVRNEDRNLLIDRQDVLNAAFRPVSVPKSMIFWISPDDQQAIEKYDKLLQQVQDGSAIIVDELKQYDANKSKFMVWIRYNEVSYALHPRFASLRQESRNAE